MALLAPWLADFQLLAAALLLGVMLAIALLRQPAQRLAVAKSTLIALAALALLSAIPGWSLVHLLNESPTLTPIASQAPLVEAPPTAPSLAPLPSEPVAAAPSPVVTAIETQPTPPPAEPINWPATIGALYAAGCALVAIWLAIGGLLAHRVLSQATPAPPELEQLLAQITGPAAHPPRLLMSNRIAAPVAMGLRRPAILLPLPRRAVALAEQQGEGFPTHAGQSEAQLLPILAHEWAHLEHRDLHTLAATRLLLILLWPQPLFWLLRHTIRLDQETLADAAAADRAGRLDYAQQLLAWARTSSTQRPPRLAGAVGLWEGPSQLKRRIAVLLNEKFNVMRSCSRRWRNSSLIAIAAISLGLSLMTLQPKDGVADEPTESRISSDEAEEAVEKKSELSNPAAGLPGDENPLALALGFRSRIDAVPNVLHGRCVSAKNEPLADVVVKLYRGDAIRGPQRFVRSVKTNAAGEFRFADLVDVETEYAGKVPATAAPNEEMFIWSTQKPGLVSCEAARPISEVAREGQANDFIMAPAASLTGTLRDEAGQPIADAIVAKVGRMTHDSGTFTARSDAEGKFTINDLAPFDLEAERRREREAKEQAEKDLAAGADSVLTFSLAPTFAASHPKFKMQTLPTSSIPAKDVAVTLSPGERLAGRVVFADGAPAANATVFIKPSIPKRGDWGILNWDRYDRARDYEITLKTDADGHFESNSLTPGEVDVWVDQPGWLNAGMSEFEVKAGEPGEIPDLTLIKGGLVRLQLIDDETGRPIDVPEPLTANVTTSMRATVGRREVWPTRYDVTRAGVLEVRTLPGEGKLSIQSIDSAAAPQWQPANSSFDALPRFEIVDGQTINLELRVRKTPQASNAQASAPAAVAAPAGSELQAKEVAERGSALVKQLAHAPNLFMGFCIDEAGQPLADVDVSLFVYQGATANENVEPLARTRTGADGKFEFSEPIDVAKEFPNGVPEDGFVTAPVKIIAAVAKAPGLTTEFKNEALYQFVKRGQAAILQMKPAQKLTGRITDDKGQPVRGAVVTTTLSVGGHVPGANLSARTDADGRYTIDDLPRFDADERARELAAARERKEPWAMFSPPGPALSVQHPDFATRRINLQVVPGELNLALLPGSTVKGRVVAKVAGVSDESKPLANVPVWITRTMQPIRDTSAAYGLVEQQQTTTDSEGNYMFTSLPASEYAVTATAPDVTTAGVTGIAVAAGQTAAAPDVVLTPGAVVRVKVLDSATKQPLKLKTGQKGYILPQRLTPGVVGAPRMDSQIADFTVDGVGEVRLAPGRYGLFVSIPGEGLAPNLESRSPDGKSTVAEFEVREGETLELDVPLIAFPLQMASGVTATVQPAVADGAVVETQEPAMSYFQSSETPADGEQPGGVPVKPQSDIPVMEGSASPETKTPATAYPAAQPKTTHQTLGMGKVTAVPLEPPKHQPNALQLHIVDENNQPLPGIEATLYSVMPPGNEAKPIKTLVTDAAGNAMFADVAPADQVARFAALKAAGEFIGGSREMYLIALKHPGLATALLYQSAGELALGGSKRTIMLRPAVKLSGQVTDPDGKPVADAVVTAGGFSGSLSIPGVNVVSTDAAGRFEFADRGPFDRAAANQDNNLMSLSLAAANSPAAQPGPAAAEDPTVKNVSDLVVAHPEFAVTQVDGGNVPGVTDVRMLPAASIIGRVIHSETGAPEAGAAVRAMGEPTELPQIKREGDVVYTPVIRTHSATTTADEQGNYRFANLPAGTYNLWVEAKNPLNEPIKLASRGVAGVVAAAGAEPTSAPDSFVGPPPVVTVKLIDAVTGKALHVDGELVAVPMALRADNPRLQAPPHQRMPVSKDGTFSFVALPGKFRLGVEVVDKPGTDYRVLYRSPDDFHSSGSVVGLQFGDRLSIDLPVYPMARLEQRRSDHAKAYQLLEEKKFDEAIAAFSKMIAEWPAAHEPLSSRCFAYRRAGRYAEAIADAESLLKRFPDNAWSKHILADLLASSPVEGTRDGKRALQFADEVVAIAKADNSYSLNIARYLELVAAAHAELGDFEKAIAVQEEAIKLAPSARPKEARDRLELYRASKPFRLKASPAAAPAKPPAGQGAATSPGVAPVIFKPVEPPPVSPTLQATAGRAVVQSADIQSLSLIDRAKPLNYSAWELKTQPAPIDLKAPTTLGDAVK